MKKLAVFISRFRTSNKLKNKRSASTDFIPTGEKITADESFENAGLTATLTSDNRDLWEVDGGLASDAGENVLKTVNERDDAGTERNGSGRRRRRWCDGVVHHDWIGTLAKVLKCNGFEFELEVCVIFWVILCLFLLSIRFLCCVENFDFESKRKDCDVSGWFYCLLVLLITIQMEWERG